MAKGEIFGSLPTWAKGIIAVAIVGGVGFIGWKIYKKVQKAEEDKGSKAVSDDAKQAVIDLQKQGGRLSFPEASYSSAINTIVKLLDGCDSFTSELQAVNEVAKVVKTPIDWYHLIEKFGKKDVPDCGYGKTNYDLTSLLKDQLDSNGIYSIDVNGYKKKGFAVNSIDILEGYLTSKGIQI